MTVTTGETVQSVLDEIEAMGDSVDVVERSYVHDDRRCIACWYVGEKEFIRYGQTPLEAATKARDAMVILRAREEGSRDA